jgi:hypothetical protein
MKKFEVVEKIVIHYKGMTVETQVVSIEHDHHRDIRADLMLNGVSVAQYAMGQESL